MPEERSGSGTKVRAYYFGCDGVAGHYMHKPGMRTDRDFMRNNPWGYGIDDGFKGLRYKDGWTALAFVDNTVDDRPGSNSVFLAEGDFTQNEMVEIAKQCFPEVSQRVNIDRFKEAR